MYADVRLRGNYVGILLAAGCSRRFGSDKLLHMLADGTPMALASAYALRDALPRIVAVVRQENEALAALFAAQGIETVIAKRADSGMGASLAAGIVASTKASGWLIALADMPYIQAQTIALVAKELELGAGIAAPRYHGRRGHPVGFSKNYRNPLLNLVGDKGARVLLQQHSRDLALIDCNDPGVLSDIDHLDDL